MRRAFARFVTIAVLISVAAGCEWLESTAAANRRGDEAMARGDWDRAIAKYSKVIGKRPDFAQAWRRRGFCYVQKGELEKGQADMREAMRLAPKFAGTRYVMGNSLVSQWKLDQAVQEFKKALEIEPNHPEKAGFHTGLAIALAGQGRIDEAMAQCRQALEASPTIMEAHYILAYCLMARHQPQQAEEEFRKALDSPQQQPEAPGLDNNRAFILATCPIQSLRNGAEAVKLAERANKKTGESHLDFLDTLAAAYAEVGRFDDAVATARKVVDLATAQNSPEMVRLMEARVALYQARKPLREPAGAN
jgi:protein O-mannosyl-transferase